MTTPRPKTRADHLTELADAVRELTETRHHTEYVVRTETVAVRARDGRTKSQRKRIRVRHDVTLPSLLEALSRAAVPGTSVTAGSPGGFESRPAAELEPMSVLREIATEATSLAVELACRRSTLASTLSALVGANHDDPQLRRTSSAAQRWVRRARLATGFDAEPVTIGDRCPRCFKKNALVVTADLTQAHCTRCGSMWDHDTIGQLAEILRANQTQETAVDVPCWMADCTRRGPHDLHQDSRGRAWVREDRCIGADGRPARVGLTRT